MIHITYKGGRGTCQSKEVNSVTYYDDSVSDENIVGGKTFCVGKKTDKMYLLVVTNNVFGCCVYCSSKKVKMVCNSNNFDIIV